MSLAPPSNLVVGCVLEVEFCVPKNLEMSTEVASYEAKVASIARNNGVIVSVNLEPVDQNILLYNKENKWVFLKNTSSFEVKSLSKK